MNTPFVLSELTGLPFKHTHPPFSCSWHEAPGERGQMCDPGNPRSCERIGMPERQGSVGEVALACIICFNLSVFPDRHAESCFHSPQIISFTVLQTVSRPPAQNTTCLISLRTHLITNRYPSGGNCNLGPLSKFPNKIIPIIR